MKNAAEYTAELIDRAKRSQKFRIVRQQPDDFMFRGRVPFNIQIKDGIMTCEVYAVDLGEANAQVDEFLDRNRDTDEEY